MNDGLVVFLRTLKEALVEVKGSGDGTAGIMINFNALSTYDDGIQCAFHDLLESCKYSNTTTVSSVHSLVSRFHNSNISQQPSTSSQPTIAATYDPDLLSNLGMSIGVLCGALGKYPMRVNSGAVAMEQLQGCTVPLAKALNTGYFGMSDVGRAAKQFPDGCCIVPRTTRINSPPRRVMFHSLSESRSQRSQSPQQQNHHRSNCIDTAGSQPTPVSSQVHREQSPTANPHQPSHVDAYRPSEFLSALASQEERNGCVGGEDDAGTSPCGDPLIVDVDEEDSISVDFLGDLALFMDSSDPFAAVPRYGERSPAPVRSQQQQAVIPPTPTTTITPQIGSKRSRSPQPSSLVPGALTLEVLSAHTLKYVVAYLTEEDKAQLIAFEADLFTKQQKELKELCAFHTLLLSGTKPALIRRLIACRAENLATKMGTQQSSMSPSGSRPPSVVVSQQQHQTKSNSAPITPTTTADPSKRRTRLDPKKFAYFSDNASFSSLGAKGPAVGYDFSLVVDHRERTGTKHSSFLDWVKEQDPLLDCIDAQLPSADYMFVNKISGAVLPVLVERKTLEDLAGSLVTPRYSQQKRLMRAVGFPLMFLIIEGDLDPKGPASKNMGPEELKRVHSGMLTSCIVDRITVLHAASRADTLHYLKAIGRAAIDQYSSCQPPPSSSSSSTLQLQAVSEQIKSMKNVLDMKSIFPAMLCNVHGCTGATATQLAQVFGNAMGMRRAAIDAFSNPVLELEFVQKILTVKKRGGAEVAIMLLRLFGGNQNHN